MCRWGEWGGPRRSPMLSCGSAAQPRATLPANRSRSTAATSCAKAKETNSCKELYSTERGTFDLRTSPNQRSPSQRMPSFGSRLHASADRTCGANVKPGSTVAVVGDGSVGLLGVPPAKQMGAERIIVMSRHESRQKLAHEFGATDIVTERGDEGVARIKELTDGIGADSVLECVGTQESMMQAISSTRRGGYVGYVGVPHGV